MFEIAIRSTTGSQAISDNEALVTLSGYSSATPLSGCPSMSDTVVVRKEWFRADKKAVHRLHVKSMVWSSMNCGPFTLGYQGGNVISTFSQNGQESYMDKNHQRELVLDHEGILASDGSPFRVYRRPDNNTNDHKPNTNSTGDLVLTTSPLTGLDANFYIQLHISLHRSGGSDW